MPISARVYPQRPIVSAHAVVFQGDRVLQVRRGHEPSRGRWSVPGGVIELGKRSVIRYTARSQKNAVSRLKQIGS
jgi:hypothetical protein